MLDRPPLSRHKELARGQWETLPESDQEVILEIIANFHYRNATHHEDGSRGDIKITHNELRDILAYVAKTYMKNGIWRQ